jgi:predicted DNA-binding transcriptional regulator YafY
MASPSSRLLRLLSLLQTRRHWPGPELAERLEVSERTLRRDIDRLRDLGYPVDARRGLVGGYQLAPGAALPPLILDDEEAIAIGVGLQVAVQGVAIIGIAEASVRALAKVIKVMPAPLRREVDALAAMTVTASWGEFTPTIDAGVLTTAAQACRDQERLGFSYNARGGEASERHVEPHRVVLLGRRWYLVAWDLDRFDWRSFRIDRLRELVNTGTRCIPRELPGGDAAAFVRRGIENVPASLEIEAVVHADAATVRARIGRWATIEDVDRDRCVVRISADSPDWAIAALGLTSADFEVLGPPEFVEHLRSWRDRFSRATSA